jgi:hypothetical protein
MEFFQGEFSTLNGRGSDDDRTPVFLGEEGDITRSNGSVGSCQHELDITGIGSHFLYYKKKTMMMKIMSSPRKDKKWRAVFTEGNKQHTVDFGAKFMENFTTHKDDKRKELFLSRFHKLIEKYKDDPKAPMTLSAGILWNKPTLEASIRDYKRRFHLN